MLSSLPAFFHSASLLIFRFIPSIAIFWSFLFHCGFIPQFVYPFTRHGHLGYFQGLVDSNWSCYEHFWTTLCVDIGFVFSWVLRRTRMGDMADARLTFSETANCLLKWCYRFTSQRRSTTGLYPHQRLMWSLFFIVAVLLGAACSVLVPHCSFNLHFPND